MGGKSCSLMVHAFPLVCWFSYGEQLHDQYSHILGHVCPHDLHILGIQNTLEVEFVNELAKERKERMGPRPSEAELEIQKGDVD